jgi:hypothetical protein
MIETRIEIDQATRARMQKILLDFSKATGKTVEQGIQTMARSAASMLAIKTQPFGVSEKTYGKMKNLIAKQAHRAISHANVAGIEGSAKSVHRQIRVDGKVPKGLQTDGQFRRSPISFGERKHYVDMHVKTAGKIKAAWIEAGESVTGKRMPAKPWIRRHIGKGRGKSEKSGEGLDYKITIINTIPWAGGLIYESDIEDATTGALKRSMNYFQRTIKKEIEKANRALK